ncbi:MAG TPA: hypothetical protein VF728_00840, partial [Nocardioides sp.]
MPHQNPEEVFEDRYTSLFTQRFVGRGTKVTYDRDRAATDLGYHLLAPGTLEHLQVKVWFQLKGIHRETLGRREAEDASFVTVRVAVRDLLFWQAGPEATYLVVYIESLDEFVAEDVRDIVGRQWPEGGLRAALDGQQSIGVRVSRTAVLTDERIAAMTKHRSMRIDGPA